MKILLTGGAGYIGSHTCVELLNAGYDVVVADDLSNAKKSVIGEIEKITKKKVSFYEIDVKDKEALDELFDKEKIDAVIHFAGFKAVGESVKKPLKYYRNNLDSTLSLLEVMENSPIETEEVCAHFGQCGGCSILSVPYEKQLEIKSEQVLKLFEEQDIRGF